MEGAGTEEDDDDYGLTFCHGDDDYESDSLADQFEAAVRAAPHLSDLDGAAVMLGRVMARNIDRGEDVSPGFLRLLNGLGLTPEGRVKLKVDDSPAQGALSGIRARRGEA